jgi:hypothetical protein
MIKMNIQQVENPDLSGEQGIMNYEVKNFKNHPEISGLILVRYSLYLRKNQTQNCTRIIGFILINIGILFYRIIQSGSGSSKVFLWGFSSNVNVVDWINVLVMWDIPESVGITHGNHPDSSGLDNNVDFHPFSENHNDLDLS